MPLYRGRRWVDETLGTLREQTFRDWRLIAVDDACPEHTGDRVEELFPEAQVLRLKRNGGAARARNIGVRETNSPFIALVDQDDLWDPTKLAKQIKALEMRPAAGACGTDALLIDERGTAIGEAPSNAGRKLDWDGAPINELLRAQFLSNRVKTASALVRREAWIDVGGQLENRPGAEDWAFWFRMLALGWRIAQVLESLHQWRQHSRNTSKVRTRNLVRYAVQLQYGIRYGHRIGVPTLMEAAHRLLRGAGPLP